MHNFTEAQAKRQVLGLLVALVVLLGSLFTTAATDNTMWFLFGWPVALILTGMHDHKPERGRTAQVIGWIALSLVIFVATRALVR